MKSNFLVVGFGVQGQKRAKLLASNGNVVTVDPHVDGADYRSIAI